MSTFSLRVTGTIPNDQQEQLVNLYAIAKPLTNHLLRVKGLPLCSFFWYVVIIPTVESATQGNFIVCISSLKEDEESKSLVPYAPFIKEPSGMSFFQQTFTMVLFWKKIISHVSSPIPTESSDIVSPAESLWMRIFWAWKYCEFMSTWVIPHACIVSGETTLVTKFDYNSYYNRTVWVRRHKCLISIKPNIILSSSAVIFSWD